MTTRIIAVVIGLLVCLTADSIAQESKNQQPVERLSLEVHVVDPDGNPIEGALVIPSGMIFAKGPNATFSWIDNEPEKVANLLTDKNGVVIVTYPKHPIENQEVARIVLKVKHTAFVELDSFVGVADGPVKIGMERGFQIAASAINADMGEPIKENLFARTSRIEPADWKQKSNGMLVSPVFGKQECDFRVVQIVDGKPVRFSNLISVDPDKNSRALFKNVKLFKAITVRGKLNSKIRRPIKNGMISACVATYNDRNRPTTNPAWHWLTFTEIADDGSYVLDGIPIDSVLQIVAMCDGWTSVPLSDLELADQFPSYVGMFRNDFFVMPQLVTVGKESHEVEIRMQQAGRCLVKVVDDEGKPVSGANVSVNSNSRFFHSGFTSGYGSARSSAGLLIQIRKSGFDGSDVELEAFFRSNYDHVATTAAKGNAVIDQLPERLVFVSARHPNFPPTSNLADPQLKVSIKSGETTESTISLTKPNE